MLKSGSCRQFIPIRIKVYSSEGRGARGSRGGGAVSMQGMLPMQLIRGCNHSS